MFPALRSLTYFTFSSAYRLLTREHATHAYRREPPRAPRRAYLLTHYTPPRTAHAPRHEPLTRTARLSLTLTCAQLTSACSRTPRMRA